MALWDASISVDVHMDGTEPVNTQVATPDWLSRRYLVVTIGKVRFYDLTAEQAEQLSAALSASAAALRATEARPSQPAAAE